MVANGSVPNMPGSGAVTGVNKRYRPAPAKTFQCRGYGECRMVFSRSEHLARHIRKHTGERPFSCHCGKQFSRLDNLRQHAQTVHADKQDQNERMMRDLTSLHATMAAASKVGSTRGPRRAPPISTMQLSSNGAGGSPTGMIKQEDQMGSLPMHQRPGTSTGYEGDMIYSSWQAEERRAAANGGGNHSFRDPGQSFLAPSAPSSAAAAAAAQSHSFRGFTSGSQSQPRPGSSSSRPPTSSGLADAQHHPRSLPPLAAVVSASLPSPPPSQQQQLPPVAGHQQQSLQQQQQLFPFLALRRPSTATRPGTAPASASFFSARPFSASGGSGLGGGGSSSSSGRPELSLLHSGFGHGGRFPGAAPGFGNEHHQLFQLGAGAAGYDQPAQGGEVPTSPSGHDASPFYFSPPGLDPAPAAATSSTSPSALNPRKRAFAGPDGPHDDAAPSAPLRGGEPPQGSVDLPAYEYGSESRPQSRRLSVMELCNDDADDALAAAAAARPASSRGPGEREYAPGSGAFLLSAAAASAAASAGHGGSAAAAAAGYGYGSRSRPTTSSGLVSSASALHIFDRSTSPPSQSQPNPPQPAGLFARAPHAAATAAGAGHGYGNHGGNGLVPGAPGAGAAGYGGGVYPASFRGVPPAGAGGGGGGSSSSAASYSAAANASTASASSPASPGSTTSAASSPSPPTPTPGVLYRPHQQHQQHHHAQQYQFAHSPTFSTSSYTGSPSPRSPLSDAGSGSAGRGGNASPFAPRSPGAGGVYDAAAAGVSRAARDGRDRDESQYEQQQSDGQVRIPVSPHAAATFGMRV
ncbi:hypothetical protein GALMADRAFT_214025 [Galerina marginata CBS 339.88]|uniref:C2H2-type domain-containing protein n=1 Tax=Galerina marginata (strain CBS 339.88) TaxID=685588 RepID=A0A067SX98_GALM3|nr:hypothetical protein GALMADRAFT_214025 [Galerina marginata CBS 339.88]